MGACGRGGGPGGAGGRGRASLEPVGECEGQGEQRVLTWTLTPWRNRGSVVFSCHNKRVEAHTTLIAWDLISFSGSSDGRRVRLLVNMSDDFFSLFFFFTIFPHIMQIKIFTLQQERNSDKASSQFYAFQLSSLSCSTQAWVS